MHLPGSRTSPRTGPEWNLGARRGPDRPAPLCDEQTRRRHSQLRGRSALSFLPLHVPHATPWPVALG